MVAFNLAALLRDAISHSAACDCIALYEMDWQVDSQTVVRPDISVICRGLPEKHIDDAPSVVAEILSLWTAGKDLTAKRALYAEQGVAFYLIMDPDEKTVTVLKLSDAQYSEVAANDVGSVSVSWCDGCSVVVCPDDVFEESNSGVLASDTPDTATYQNTSG